ncbi:MAG: ATPase [Chlamydiia bacterium]|nr:ATPase [Chlamydiia bacterium]
MQMIQFIGRKKEFADLQLLLKKMVASFVVVRGRRRIGKSRLIEEFGKSARFLEFTGLPPTKGTTAKKQRQEFMRQFKENCGYSSLDVDDWGDIFSLLAKETATGRVIILLDEISWMGSKDSTFLGKLKIAWDIHFKKNSQLILIICGSVSSWIEKNILSHTGFVGRISRAILLEELSLPDCKKLLETMGCRYPHEEFFKLLGVTGGIPRYLEEIQRGMGVDENIKRICFCSDGLLFREFDQLFSDLFSKKKETYKKVVQLLANQEMETQEVANHLGYSRSGYVSNILNDLVKAGFLKVTYAWDLQTQKEKKKPRFRLTDNYLRFYLKYIEPNRGRIEKGHFDQQSLTAFPGWAAMMGLQFENLVIHNSEYVFNSLYLSREDILFDNPYLQRQTSTQQGCQIDYLIQTRYRMLFACEIKFSRQPLTLTVVEEMKQKIKRLKLPRGFAINPVLIYLNGVSDSVIDANYFTHLIDFSEILKS